MRKLRVIYKPYRIGLFAVALALAVVSMIENFRNANVDVRLPSAQSSDVLPVFVANSKFARIGYSGRHAWSSVNLYAEQDYKDSDFSFCLVNYGDTPVYLPRLRSNTVSSHTAVPYFIECQYTASGLVHAIPSQFEFQLDPVRLDPKKELTFSITPPPPSARRCVVIVPLADSRESARDLAQENPFSSVTEEWFFEGDFEWDWEATIWNRYN